RIRKQRVHLGITYESIAASLEVIVTYHYCAGRVVCATEEVGIRGEVLSTVPPAHSGDKTGDSVHEVAPGTVDCGFMRLRSAITARFGSGRAVALSLYLPHRCFLFNPHQLLFRSGSRSDGVSGRAKDLDMGQPFVLPNRNGFDERTSRAHQARLRRMNFGISDCPAYILI